MAKLHLFMPGEVDRLTMCSRSTGLVTDDPAAVTCETCKQRYQNNEEWYAAALRRAKHGVCKNCGSVIEMMARQKTDFCCTDCERAYESG